MCNVCDQAAEIVSENTDGKLTAMEVRAVVTAFQNVSELLQAGADPEQFSPEAVAQASDEWVEDGHIPAELMSALVDVTGGPVVVVGATPIDGGVAIVTSAASTDTEQVERMLREAHSAFANLMPDGGMREDGAIVTPMVTRKWNAGPA